MVRRRGERQLEDGAGNFGGVRSVPGGAALPEAPERSSENQGVDTPARDVHGVRVRAYGRLLPRAANARPPPPANIPTPARRDRRGGADEMRARAPRFGRRRRATAEGPALSRARLAGANTLSCPLSEPDPDPVSSKSPRVERRRVRIAVAPRRRRDRGRAERQLPRRVRHRVEHLELLTRVAPPGRERLERERGPASPGRRRTSRRALFSRRPEGFRVWRGRMRVQQRGHHRGGAPMISSGAARTARLGGVHRARLVRSVDGRFQSAVSSPLLACRNASTHDDSVLGRGSRAMRLAVARTALSLRAAASSAETATALIPVDVGFFVVLVGDVVGLEGGRDARVVVVVVVVVGAAVRASDRAASELHGAVGSSTSSSSSSSSFSPSSSGLPSASSSSAAPRTENRGGERVSLGVSLTPLFHAVYPQPPRLRLPRLLVLGHSPPFSSPTPRNPRRCERSGPVRGYTLDSATATSRPARVRASGSLNARLFRA